MVVVFCPHCGSQLIFSGKHRIGRQHCVNCKGEIEVPEQPMSEEEVREALKRSRPPLTGGVDT